MWCKQCRQDVPGMVSEGKGVLSCPRCGGGLAGDSSGSVDEAMSEGTGPTIAESTAALPPYDGWELDEQLRRIQRALDTQKAVRPRPQEADRQEVARVDPPQACPSSWHRSPVGRSGTTAEPRAAGSQAALTLLSWVALSLGTATFVCGAALLGRSTLTGQQELWSVGMPVALCGQIALLVGLILQLDRLWHDSRQAAAKLDQVDQQLIELKTATRMLDSGHGSPAGDSRSHLADGTGAELLLSDLKSRLDLLALKIGQTPNSDE